MSDRVREVTETERLGRRAAELGREDAVALCNGGHALAFVVGDLDMATTMIDRALVLNPNLAAAWRFSGWLRVYLGQPQEAIEHLARAMRLSPFDALFSDMQRATSFAHLIAGQYDEAMAWAEQALREQPDDVTSMRMAAASYALAGRLEEAQSAMSRMRARDPSLRVSNLKDLGPVRRPEDFARWAEGLRKAGLPE